jgi:hypothetical protein
VTHGACAALSPELVRDPKSCLLRNDPVLKVDWPLMAEFVECG